MRAMFHLLLLLGMFNLGICLPRQYIFVNESKTWSEAQKYCREIYADLATIKNAEEELAVAVILYGWKSNKSWIGLYDDLNSWKWSLDDDSFYMEGERSYKNWYIEKPKNWYGISLCVYLSDSDGVWRETSCSTMLPFICFDGRVNSGEKYVPVYQSMNWTEAQRYCREHYTDLSSVRNESENQKIRSLILNKKYYSSFWIGLYRTKSWSDKSNYSFSNWKPGQPDNYRQNESCTAVSFNDSGKWTDENCGQAFPFLCYSKNTMPSGPSRQYYFVNEKKTWNEAQRHCREIYTDLGTIDSMEEMNTIFNSVNGNYSGLVWIGLYGDMDNWRWSLDNDAFYQEAERDFRGWERQPDNYNGQELCVYVYSDGTWFDGDCSRYLPFVCYDGKNGTVDYTLINQPMPWRIAQHYCREHYTDLASVRNQTDNERILNLTLGSLAWIGLYRTRIWSDKKELTYESWRPATPKQPDNGLDNHLEYLNQHCTAVSFRDSGYWTDEDCLATLPFICYNKFCSSLSCILQYHFIEKNKTWNKAQRYCRKKYTDLATIHNMREMNKLLNTVNGIYSGLAWIGLYDDLKSWKWSLGYSFFYKNDERNFRNWHIHKPWAWNGNNLCAYIAVYGAIWWEESCSTKLPFICFDGSVKANKRFVLVYQHMNWTEAQMYCREHYTDLASVRNETENHKIRSLLRHMNNDHYSYYDHNYHNYYYYGFWIGLYRTSTWSDGSNYAFSNWKPGQPDNSGQTESCAAVSFNDDYNYGNWTSENCGEAFSFLCYSKISSTSSHHYHFVNESKSWMEAQRYCREKYVDLATIDSMEEMNTLLNTVNGSYLGLAWIGLYDDLDSWRWSLEDDAFYQDGGRDFRGWNHQPDNYNGSEMCVSMGYKGEWFDWPCSEKKSFVCYDALGKNKYVWKYTQVTWREAQRFCRANYIDLVSVRNKIELQQILSITKGYEVWIGLYRKRLWSDQSKSTFTYWRPGNLEPTPEPDNGVYSPGQRGSQHCTAVDNSGRWTDENCFASFPFICYTSEVTKIPAKKKQFCAANKIPVMTEFQQEPNRLKRSRNYTECENHL